MNRFFLVTVIIIIFLGCEQNQFVVVPELPNVPFVWAYYVENSKNTYAQVVAYDDIYGDKPITIYEDLLLDDRYDICLKKNDVSFAYFNHFIYEDTLIQIINNVGQEPDTIISIGRPTAYNFFAETESTIPDKAGDIFELRVQHPEFGEMYAQQKMPEEVPINKLELLGIEIAPSGFYRANLQITLDDPSEMANYYEITGAFLPLDDMGNASVDDIGLVPLNIGADDPEIIDYDLLFNRSSIYLADNSFNGQTKKITFWVDILDPALLEEDLYIIWRCVSPEWYRFFEARRSSFQNPFLTDTDNLTQPYSLPFNIEGDGFGLFGVGTEEIYKVE